MPLPDIQLLEFIGVTVTLLMDGFTLDAAEAVNPADFLPISVLPL